MDRHFLYVLFFLVASGFCFGDKLPDARDISAVDGKVGETYMDLIKNTVDERMVYFYSGRVCEVSPKARRALEQAQKATAVLFAEIEGILRDIETYEGADWDSLYGQSGLWRKAVVLRERIIFSRLYCGYVSALFDQRRKDELLGSLIELLKSDHESRDRQLLLIKAILLAGEDSSKEDRQRVFRWMQANAQLEGVKDRAYFEGRLLRLRFVAGGTAEDVQEVYELLKESEFSQDLELHLMAGFAGCRTGDGGGVLKEILAGKFSDFTGYAARIAAKDFTCKFQNNNFDSGYLGEREQIEIRLGCVGMTFNAGQASYIPAVETILKRLKEPDWVVYVAAGFAYEPVRPEKALSLYLDAIEEWVNDPVFGIMENPVSLSGHCVDLLVQMPREKVDCGQAGRVHENYVKHVKEGSAERDYRLASVLEHCGSQETAEKLFEKTAGYENPFRTRSELKLIIKKLSDPKADRDEALEKVQSIYERLSNNSGSEEGQDAEGVVEIVTQMFCNLMLESQSDAGAKKVLELAGEKGGVFTLCRARAYLKLGSIEKAATHFADAVGRAGQMSEADRARLVSGCAGALAELMEALEDAVNSGKADSENAENFFADCRIISDFVLSAGLEDQRAINLAKVLWIRSVLELPSPGDEQVARAGGFIEQLMGTQASETLDFLICRALLYENKGTFDKAAVEWGKVAGGLGQNEGQKGDKWYRAKYRQFFCYSRTNNFSEEHFNRALNILIAEMGDYSGTWKSKILSLKGAKNDKLN